MVFDLCARKGGGVIVLLWLLFGLASGTVAHYKGHSFIGWLLLGVVFGPFALVVIACMPSNVQEPVAIDDSVEEGPERVCPFCRSWIPCSAFNLSFLPVGGHAGGRS
jgi:hypothetical protein